MPHLPPSSLRKKYEAALKFKAYPIAWIKRNMYPHQSIRSLDVAAFAMTAKEQTPARKVLIVEDNELNLKLFKDILDAHHLITVETRDGRNAVDIAMRERPDLIIMDIQLPYISGIDLIRNMKALKELKDIPIVAVTAFAMQSDREQILATGCESYLAKPISVASFVETIQKYLGTVVKL